MARAQTSLRNSGRWITAFATAALLALAPHAASAGKFKVLHSFCGSGDGCIPLGGLTADGSGNLFGATAQGGPSNMGQPFELRRDAGTGKLKYTLISFCRHNQCSAVIRPIGDLVVDVAGNLYGVSAQGNGAVFELSPPTVEGAKWTSKILYSFCLQQNCADGQYPTGGLAYVGQGSGQLYDGSSPLYGTTAAGGANAAGTVYKLSGGGNAWTESVIYNFCSQGGSKCTDGKRPLGVTIDSVGNLFGATSQGGNAFENTGAGVVYELSPNGGLWSETILYSFCATAKCSDGAFPVGSLVMDAGQNLFGTTAGGGGCRLYKTSGCGVLYRISLTGGAQESLLYAFCQKRDCKDGLAPLAGPVLGIDGALYGTTSEGGGNDIDHSGAGGGTLYRFSESQLTTLHSFCAEPNCYDGAAPETPLVMDSQGAIYGTTPFGGEFGNNSTGGVIFQLTN